MALPFEFLQEGVDDLAGLGRLFLELSVFSYEKLTFLLKPHIHLVLVLLPLPNLFHQHFQKVKYFMAY